MRVTSLTAALVTCLTAGVAAQDTTQQRQDTVEQQGQTTPSNITVEVVLTSAVLERMPQDTVTTIPAPVADSAGMAGLDTLFLWTRVSGAEPGTVLHHVWFKGDEQVGDVSLNIGGSPWRTWSSKVIPAEATGAWRVEVRDESGNVLGTVNFTVGS